MCEEFEERQQDLLGSISVLGATYPTYNIFVIVVGALAAVGLGAFVYRTRFGVMLRATSQDMRMASALGINVKRVYVQAFTLGCLMAGLGGAVVMPISGAVLHALGVERTQAQQLLLSLTLRGLLFAAVRLGIAGTHEAQRMLHEMSPALDEVLAACGGLGEDAIAQTAPLADLFGSTHDRLYSRLFQS